MTQVSMGSRNSDVSTLQKKLNSKGYKLAEDGIFGNNTLAAVKDYQTKNGLAVDGIVGKNTWASLLGGGSSATKQAATELTNPTAPTAPTAPANTMATTAKGTEYDTTLKTPAQADIEAIEGSAPTYQRSKALDDALAELQAAKAAKPGEYKSSYADQIAALYDQVANPEAFKYNASEDPIYMQYADRYQANARRGMEDMMANAAQLSGGYGNSYAAAAGQQAYDQTMSGMNDVMLDLYNGAYDRYNADRNNKYNALKELQGLEQTEYGRYQDGLNDYYDNINALANMAQTMESNEYKQYQDQLDQYNADRSYYKNKYDDEQAMLAAEMAAQGSGGGSSGGGSRKSGGSGSGALSSYYKTILANAKDMTSRNAYDYVARMADQGYLTNEEADKMLSMDIGIDVKKYAGGGSSSTDKNSTAGKVASTIGNAVKTGTSSLNNLTNAASKLMSKLKK